MACGTGGLVARSLVLQLSYQKLGSKTGKIDVGPCGPRDGKAGLGTRQGFARWKPAQHRQASNVCQRAEEKYI